MVVFMQQIKCRKALRKIAGEITPAMAERVK